MHINSGACLSKMKLFLTPALIGRYVTLLYDNIYLKYWIWLEKDHLHGFHSNLSTFPN